MNYLTDLAEKLVTAYQDQENLLVWVSRQGRDGQKSLVVAVRSVIEQEIAAGRLRNESVCGEKVESTAPLLKAS
ncbi:MAG: hypothetical protein ABSE59_11620 [Opitutaceae bacterium]|jgi:hypothetical protein